MPGYTAPDKFKIAKSEFPILSDEIFYVSVSGYGTMAIEDTNYWVYPNFGYPLPHIFSSVSDKHHFLPFDMSIT